MDGRSVSSRMAYIAHRAGRDSLVSVHENRGDAAASLLVWLIAFTIRSERPGELGDVLD